MPYSSVYICGLMFTQNTTYNLEYLKKSFVFLPDLHTSSNLHIALDIFVQYIFILIVSFFFVTSFPLPSGQNPDFASIFILYLPLSCRGLDLHIKSINKCITQSFLAVSALEPKYWWYLQMFLALHLLLLQQWQVLLPPPSAAPHRNHLSPLQA